MKVVVQINTSTLGDMVIEETDEKTTTNREDQKAIVVELLVQALSKITAAYKIPKDMLDLGDEEYEGAHERKTETDKAPRFSSAAANRAVHIIEPTHGGHNGWEKGCYCDRQPEEDDELVLSEDELVIVTALVETLRRNK